MDLLFDRRRTLIVGASYGIGFATASLAAAEGADLLLVSRSQANLEDAARALKTSPAPALLAADVTQPEGGDKLAGAVADRWGALDVLVTAVGGSVRSSFQDLTDEQWADNYTYNVTSTVRAIRATLPFLRNGYMPAIVILGAASAKMPYAHQIASNTHKAGLLALSKTLAQELAAEGIRVNLVGPGRTLTPLWLNRAKKLASEQQVSEEDIIRGFSEDIPMKRFANPTEVATMVVWLSSPRASYITGQAINVDGGIARGLI
ncbi:MAG TPA: SDR family oxidoreductase [Microvirga sp.]|jgi:3-oxoacyl-[acyl-carrier protein] reductase|nr:SDR family oxidoreductase [Microvirga sp.]